MRGTFLQPYFLCLAWLPFLCNPTPPANHGTTPNELGLPLSSLYSPDNQENVPQTSKQARLMEAIPLSEYI